MVLVSLECLDNILKNGEKLKQETGFNKYSEMLEEIGGLDKIEGLQANENENIYEKVVQILEIYFAADQDN